MATEKSLWACFLKSLSLSSSLCGGEISARTFGVRCRPAAVTSDEWPQGPILRWVFEEWGALKQQEWTGLKICPLRLGICCQASPEEFHIKYLSFLFAFPCRLYVVSTEKSEVMTETQLDVAWGLGIHTSPVSFSAASAPNHFKSMPAPS